MNRLLIEVYPRDLPGAALEVGDHRPGLIAWRVRYSGCGSAASSCRRSTRHAAPHADLAAGHVRHQGVAEVLRMDKIIQETFPEVDRSSADGPRTPPPTRRHQR